jgi:phosphate transporter
VSFVQWLAFAVPSSLAILIAYWLYLAAVLWRTRPAGALPDVELGAPAGAWTFKHCLTVGVTIATIALWAVNTVAEDVLGHEGITSLIPVVVFFATGVLDSQDFGALRWSTLALMGGGLALGEAMRVSQLLDILGSVISDSLRGINQWVILLISLLFVAAVTSVISHTSGAAILFPVIGIIGDACGQRVLFLAAAALMISGSQLFHISSFPNALVSGLQAHSKADPRKMQAHSFLSGKDFVVMGWPTVLLAVILIASATYGIVRAMQL